MFIVLAPLLGLTLAMILTVALSWALRRAVPRKVDRYFRVLQLASAAAYSLGHGSNDAQKTMGIIVGLLVAEQALFENFVITSYSIHYTKLYEQVIFIERFKPNCIPKALKYLKSGLIKK